MADGSFGASPTVRWNVRLAIIISLIASSPARGTNYRRGGRPFRSEEKGRLGWIGRSSRATDKSRVTRQKEHTAVFRSHYALQTCRHAEGGRIMAR
ncbi:hypothetical protein LZ30DRAFT_381905 [Colletotrichum cereale]|nr:hypothetical protein LZ30DRAFT_381905 [Colletotrichum cereale]